VHGCVSPALPSSGCLDCNAACALAVHCCQAWQGPLGCSAGLWASVVWSFLQIFLPVPPIGKTIFALLGARFTPGSLAPHAAALPAHVPTLRFFVLLSAS